MKLNDAEVALMLSNISTIKAQNVLLLEALKCVTSCDDMIDEYDTTTVGSETMKVVYVAIASVEKENADGN